MPARPQPAHLNSDYKAPTLNPNGTVTYYSLYWKRWVTEANDVPDRELALMSKPVRDRVINHLQSTVPPLSFWGFCEKYFPDGVVSKTQRDTPCDKWVPMSTAREFYSDYRESALSIDEYIKQTTTEIG